jgi:intron-binding protein aquarius
MEGVEHLGQYVFEMAQAKVKAMGGQDAIANESMPGEEDDLIEEDGDEDPLHEHVYT